MKFVLIAWVVITLPALTAIFFFAGHELMLPALASLVVNSIPFAVAALLFRKSGKGEEAH